MTLDRQPLLARVRSTPAELPVPRARDLLARQFSPALDGARDPHSSDTDPDQDHRHRHRWTRAPGAADFSPCESGQPVDPAVQSVADEWKTEGEDR